MVIRYMDIEMGHLGLYFPESFVCLLIYKFDVPRCDLFVEWQNEEQNFSDSSQRNFRVETIDRLFASNRKITPETVFLKAALSQ